MRKRREKKVKIHKLDPIEKPVNYRPVKRKPVIAKTEGQLEYIRAIKENELIICEGLPGTGKTHIAIGMAIHALDKGHVERIIISRPILEAGERLGYLPGVLEQKAAPYMRPIFDELKKYASFNEIAQMQNDMTLEIAPLAYMRGRTLNNAFVICDECQNITHDQMKMLFTRLGDASKMVFTGDVGQSDLRKYERGAFQKAFERFKDISSVACVKLGPLDVVRNPLIAQLMEAWDRP